MIPILTWLIVLSSVVSFICIMYCAFRRPRQRDVDDVVPFLRPVDISMAEWLLDPAAEFELRWNLSPRLFRQAQRKRMRLYLEVIRRMANNAKLLAKYAEAEAHRCDPCRVGLVSAVQDKAIEMRAYVLMAGIDLLLWLPLHSKMLPNRPALARLRREGDIDGLQTYNALKAAAAAAFLRLPPDEMDSLTRNL